MSDALHERLRELREAFDRGFAEPPPERDEAGVELLGIRAGSRVLDVRIAELSRIHGAPRIVPVPGAPAGMLGLAAIRGRITPVWSIAAFLGGEAEPPRFIALVPAEGPLGLAFAGVLGQRRVPSARILASGDGTGLTPELARHDDGSRPVIRVPALAAAIRRVASGETTR